MPHLWQIRNDSNNSTVCWEKEASNIKFSQKVGYCQGLFCAGTRQNGIPENLKAGIFVATLN